MDEDEYISAEIIETDISDLCRICGSSSESPLIPIFEENGLTENLASKIMLYLPIKVAEEDILPVKVCVMCTNSILTFHLLYECCVDADRRFKSMLSISIVEQLVVEPQHVDATKCKLVQNLEQEKGGKNVHDDDQEAQIYVAMAEDAVDPIKSDREMDDIMFLRAEFGPEDEQYLDDESNPNNDGNESENGDQKPIKLPASIENLPDCEVALTRCKLTNANISEYVKPIDFIYIDTKSGAPRDVKNKKTISTNEKYSCSECQIAYITKSDFHSHLLEMHKNNQEFLAMLGHKPTKIDKKTIREARTNIDNRDMYKCHECGKLLTSAYSLRNHLFIHTNERPYICIFCDKAFRIYTGIVRHIQGSHLQIKNYTCEICQNKFVNRVNLQQHYRLHTDERPYVCDGCGKSFRQKASLFIHTRTHQNMFPYKCSYCDKGFRAKTPMLLHVSIHTKIKPHKCEMCNKMFRLKNDLTKHKQLHTDVKKYSCTECQHAFKQKRYLSRHYKLRHPGSVDSTIL